MQDLLNETWGKLHFWLHFIGFHTTFLVMHVSGLLGMPRRVADYDPQFYAMNLIATIGAYLLGTSTLPFMWNVAVSLFKGEVAGDNPWDAKTLEWQTSSPPSIFNWDETHQPHVGGGPYDYGRHPLSSSIPATGAAHGSD